ncbi:basic proline-rich protein-like [Gallus gallus]|uniref:basic proline-rich protein-like n=1 Tax=Gallus gallus TaxID=9031 RepID=UPI001F01EEB4|nr:basic proline-rich protein-like [Gallus gallus]
MSGERGPAAGGGCGRCRPLPAAPGALLCRRAGGGAQAAPAGARSGGGRSAGGGDGGRPSRGPPGRLSATEEEEEKEGGGLGGPGALLPRPAPAPPAAARVGAPPAVRRRPLRGGGGPRAVAAAGGGRCAEPVSLPAPPGRPSLLPPLAVGGWCFPPPPPPPPPPAAAAAAAAAALFTLRAGLPVLREAGGGPGPERECCPCPSSLPSAWRCPHGGPAHPLLLTHSPLPLSTLTAMAAASRSSLRHWPALPHVTRGGGRGFIRTRWVQPAAAALPCTWELPARIEPPSRPRRWPALTAWDGSSTCTVI